MDAWPVFQNSPIVPAEIDREGRFTHSAIFSRMMSVRYLLIAQVIELWGQQSWFYVFLDRYMIPLALFHAWWQKLKTFNSWVRMQDANLRFEIARVLSSLRTWSQLFFPSPPVKIGCLVRVDACIGRIGTSSFVFSFLAFYRDKVRFQFSYYSLNFLA